MSYVFTAIPTQGVPMSPEERKKNAGWAVRPELKKYISDQAWRQRISESQYVENLIIADRELRSMNGEDKEPEPKPRNILKGGKHVRQK